MILDLFFKNNILKTQETSIFKAKNILSTQLGSLAYAPTFGIDYNLFFSADYKIQDQTFRSYAISKLSENGVNTQEILTNQETFQETLNIKID